MERDVKQMNGFKHCRLIVPLLCRGALIRNLPFQRTVFSSNA